MPFLIFPQEGYISYFDLMNILKKVSIKKTKLGMNDKQCSLRFKAFSFGPHFLHCSLTFKKKSIC